MIERRRTSIAAVALGLFLSVVPYPLLAASNVGCLIVRLTPFNFSDGINSAEAADFRQRQGASFGQEHLTSTVGVDYECTLFIIPATAKGVDKVRKSISLFQTTDCDDPYTRLVKTYWVSDWLGPLAYGLPTKISPITPKWFEEGGSPSPTYRAAATSYYRSSNSRDRVSSARGTCGLRRLSPPRSKVVTER